MFILEKGDIFSMAIYFLTDNMILKNRVTCELLCEIFCPGVYMA